MLSDWPLADGELPPPRFPGPVRLQVTPFVAPAPVTSAVKVILCPDVRLFELVLSVTRGAA